MIALKNYVAGETLNLPTKFEEIDIEYINDCVGNISLADNHCIVALIYKEKMTVILGAAKANGANQKSSIVYPILAKADNQGICTERNWNIGDKLIISGTDLSRGYHLFSKTNRLSVDKVVKFIMEDKELLKECSLHGSISRKLIEDGSYNFFVEFKEIPICDIKGAYPKDSKSCKFVEKLQGTRSTLIL